MADEANNSITEMLERYEKASEACAVAYDEASNDRKFVTVPGNQWAGELKSRRANRPCYEFPKLQAHCRQVVNEMRQSRPQGKVRGVEDSDQPLAELMQGLCRNIESVSNAEQAYDAAFQSAVEGGMGVWRITTDYASQDDFDLDVYVKPIYNPASVKFDPAAVERDKRDGNFCFVEEFISKTDFERKYPKATVQDFEADHARDWQDDGKVRIAEYWYKQPCKREILALSNGEVVDAAETPEADLAAAGLTVTKRRTVDDHKVLMRLTNGREWLTEAYEFPSKFIPIVPVWGNINNIDGEEYWYGMVRWAKDQQRLHNVHRTAVIEAVAKSPKAPFITKLKWIKGLESFWNKANAEDYPYLPVNDEADGMPQRAEQAQIPTALIQLAGMDNDDLKATTGIYDASLGARSNETSGIAIGQRKQQGAVATFNYLDNLTQAIRYTYEILIDIIPKVYDTPRVVRIIGQDGGEKWKQLYQQVQDPQTGQTHTLNDLSRGKYDVVVTVGPSYSTQRMESVDSYTQLAGQLGASFPPLAALLAYQVVKNLDLPGSDETGEALRTVLVKQGLLPPKDGEQPPQQEQAPPDPTIAAKVQLMAAQAESAHATAQKVMAEAQAVPDRTQAQVYKDQAIANHQHMDNIDRIHQQRVLAAVDDNPLPPHIPQPNQPPQGGFFTPDNGQG